MRSSARHAIALTTIGLLTWLGVGFVTAKPLLGGVLLSLAAFRLGAWVSQLVRARRSVD